jgi:hypothetical protein
MVGKLIDLVPFGRLPQQAKRRCSSFTSALSTRSFLTHRASAEPVAGLVGRRFPFFPFLPGPLDLYLLHHRGAPEHLLFPFVPPGLAP